MGKLDELQAKISACYRNRQVLVKAFDDEVQKYEAEIAKLEAASKPREIMGYLDPQTGNISLHKLSSMLGSEEILFREVTPLVITREMAEKMQDIYDAGPHSMLELPKLVAILKAAGIEAIPEGGA